MRRRQSKSARLDRRMSARRFIASAFTVVLSLGVAGSFWMFASSVSGQAPAQCADGIDNDGDGQVDALTTGGNPSATLMIGAGNPFAIRAIVNTGGYGIPDNGAIHRDAVTVNKVCQIQGYTAASGSDCTAPPYDNRCGWRSFGDNLMFAWNGSSFYSIRDNVWTSTVTCVGIPAACADGKDNDGDGMIDTADTGCANASDASEVAHDAGCVDAADQFEGARQCSDGIDNDNDGKADAAGGDPGCADANDDDEEDPAPEPPAPNPPTPDPPAPDPSGDTCALEFSSCGQSAEFFGTAVSCREGRCVFADGTLSRETCTCSATPVQCTVGFHCFTGTLNGNLCNPGKTTEFEPGNTACNNPSIGGTNGKCYRCVDDNGNVDDDPPLMCPVGCAVDADCGGVAQCEGGVGDPSVPLCWKDADGLCVKKCKIPRCVDNKCTLAPPAEGTPGYPYVQCAGMTNCPAARCGDGVVQAGEAAQDPGPAPDDAPSGTTKMPNDNITCNGYRDVTGKLSDTKPSCSGGWFVEAADGRCNCIMAAAPAAKPSVVASLIDGSSLLATSIVNNCSLSCSSGFQCGPGETCFALINARNVQRQCAPADCSGREAECGMTAYGNMQWQMCPGSEVPPSEPGPGDPVGQPTPADGEECDDGNNVSNDGCSPSCKKETCGDGAVQPKGADGLPNTADDELCDDGNRDIGDGCGNTCKVETCGDGKIDYGEECDKGIANSDTAPGACRMNCTLPRCNDGVVDVWPQDFGLDEQCDCGPEYADFDWVEANKPGSTLKPYCETVVDGKPALCHVGNCQAFYCGDGFTFNAGLDNESGTEDDEMCDAGPFNSDGLPAGAECANAAQCGGFPCVQGKCEEDTCFNDSGCDAGLSCIKGMCRPGGCNADADCKAGQKCDLTTGNCSSCTVDTDCASGYCYPNGSCAPMNLCDDGACEPKGYGCRMDCKMARCGDGIVDEQAGETCDEGEQMFKCNGFPQPACDCGTPSWGSHEPGVGPFNTTCCPEGQYCSVWATATCPADCGVSTSDPIGRGACGNHQLDGVEECDTSVDGWQGEFSDWADAQVDYAYRPNRDGTQTAFVSDDGKWSVVPATIEDKYTTVDHAPATSSPDGAYIKTAGAGSAKTYFHLWDIPLTANTTFSNVRVQAGVDFSGNGTDWKVVQLPFALTYNTQTRGNFLSAVDMNAAVLEIVADESLHTLTFRLYHSTTGTPLTAPLVMTSSLPPVGRSAIAIDAVQVAAFGTSLDASYSCNECALIRCGNRIEDPGETCDDGNAAGGDGCSDRCELEICALPE